MRQPGLKVQAALYALAAAVVYYVGYRLYALDREIIYTWINIIHYITPGGITIIVVASTAAAYLLSKREVTVEHHIPLLLIIAAAATVPYLGATQPESDFIQHYDAARYVQTRGVVEGVLSLGERGYDKPPLLPVLYALAFRVFGEDYMTVETLHRLIYVLLPVVVYLTGKELWNPEVGFHAGLLTLATPSILEQNYLLMQDIPVTFLTALTVYFTLKAYSSRRYAAAAVASSLATVLTKNNGLLFVAATVPAAITYKTVEGGYDGKRMLYSLGVLSAVVLLAAASLIVLPAFREVILGRARSIVGNYWGRLFTLNSAIPITSVFYQVGLIQSLLILPAAAYAVRRRDVKLIPLASWLLVPLLVLWGMRVRYMMPAFPALSLFIAAGLSGADERLGKTMIYSAALIMLAVTLITTPLIVNDYVFKNIMYAAAETDSLDVKTVGVYTDFVHPWMREAPLVSAVDYYSRRKVVYLGDEDIGRRTGHRRDYVMPAIYVHGNHTRDYLDEVITENYTLWGEWSGGVYYYHDPYYVGLYLRRKDMGGPTDAIIHASNVNRMENVYSDLGFKSKAKRYEQQYSFGPITLASYYGTHIEDWLGERQILVKPPDRGEMNVTRTLKLPVNSSLSFSISLRPDTWHPLKGDGVRFRVYASNDKLSRVLADKYLDPKNNPEDRRLIHYNIPLTEYWGANTTFTFQTTSGPNNSSMYDTAGYGNPAIIVT